MPLNTKRMTCAVCGHVFIEICLLQISACRLRNKEVKKLKCPLISIHLNRPKNVSTSNVRIEKRTQNCHITSWKNENVLIEIKNIKFKRARLEFYGYVRRGNYKFQKRLWSILFEGNIIRHRCMDIRKHIILSVLSFRMSDIMKKCPYL